MSNALREARRRAGLSLVLAGTLFGCSDPPVVTASPKADGSAAAAAAQPGPAASGLAAPTSSSSASASPPAKVEVQETEFSETERSRDPFRSFAKSFAQDTKVKVHSQREVILSQYALDELKLIGIVTRAEPAKAMLVDPRGTGHVVQRGQFVGKPDIVQAAGRTGASYEINWRVDRIRDGDIVLIREDPSNPDVPSATRVIPLRPEGTDVEGK
jgi:type IV pilus assembly protein PilP